MALFLTESEVLELLPMERAIEQIESSFIAQHKGEAINRSRERIFLPHSSLYYMAAALPADNLLGMKIYTVTRSAWRFVVLLFDAASGALLAVLEADHLGRIRTGAASGVATKFMARREARRELDDAAISRAGVIAVDSREQARRESGDLIQGLISANRGWESVRELHEIVGGSARGRYSEEEITIFKSNGIALWDVAAAGYVYRQAIEQGRGRKLEVY